MDEARLPLTDHLAELRNRLFKIVLAWAQPVSAAGRSSQTLSVEQHLGVGQ